MCPRALTLDNGVALNGLNQAQVIVSSARHIDPFRDRPHAQQKVNWRGPQAFDPTGSPLELGNILAGHFEKLWSIYLTLL